VYLDVTCHNIELIYKTAKKVLISYSTISRFERLLLGRHSFEK